MLNENGIYDFSGKKMAITGYGRTAKAIAEFMKENGAKVLICLLYTSKKLLEC